MNLFGKFDSIKKFEVNPILLEKENADGTVSKVALYGISSQRDDRLARAFQGALVVNRPAIFALQTGMWCSTRRPTWTAGRTSW